MKFPLKITSAVAINGKMYPKDSKLEAEADIAKNLLARGKAELDSDFDFQQQDEAEGDGAEKDNQADSQQKTAQPRSRRK